MNGWPRQKRGIRVRSQHDALVCVVAQDDLKKTIWSTSGAEASACRDALDFAEYTRAIWCQVVIGGEVLLDEWKKEHDHRFDCLAKNAGVPEDRRTALTRNVQDVSVMQMDLEQKVLKYLKTQHGRVLPKIHH